MNGTKITALLAGALLLAGTLALPADAQQGPRNGSGTQAGRQTGPGDGIAPAPAPKDGTGYGKTNGRSSTAPGTCTGTGHIMSRSTRIFASGVWIWTSHSQAA